MRLRLLCAVLLANLMAVLAHAGTVTGTIQRPNGQPLANGVLTFSLSQSGVTQSGAITVTADNVYCGTSSTGTVVGVTDPAAAAVLSANYGAGTLPATQYYVEYTYTSASGESFTSRETTFLMSGSGTLNGNAPSLQPGNATGYKAYIGTSSGGETLQQTIVGFAGWSQSAALGAGAAPPVSNSTQCNTLIFNDAITPSYTTYLVNLLDSKGKQVAGYPQRYYFSGATLDLSTLAPAANLYARFPTAIVAQPGGNGLQSIAGPLSLGANSFFAGSLNGSSLNVSLATITNAGVFTNTQMNVFASSSINGLTFGTEYQAAQGNNFSTEGFASGVAVPNTSTVHQADGIAGYVNNSSTGTNAVAGYFQSRVLVNGATGWAVNGVSRDVAGLTTGVTLYGNELDVNPLNPITAYNGVVGMQVELNTSQVSPGTYPGNGAYFVHSGTAGARWFVGFQTADDAAATAALFGATCTTGSCASQPIKVRSFSSGVAKTGSASATLTADRTWTLPDNSGTVTLQVATGTATVDLASVASGACTADSSNVTLTGALVGDPVRVAAATALPAGVWLIGRVTAADTGRFQLCNLSGGAVDRASDTYTISVVK